MIKKLGQLLYYATLNVFIFILVAASLPDPVQITPGSPYDVTEAGLIGQLTVPSQDKSEQTPEPLETTATAAKKEAITDKTPKQKVAQKRPQTVKSPLIQEYVLGDFVIRTSDNQKYPIREYTPSLTPNDPQAGQWWETSMNLPQAWDLGTGSDDTTLAIIDTGFALDHEEFSGRWHINSGESGLTISENPSQLNCTDQSLSLDKNCNLIDDNFDGIVDNESGATTQENTSQLNCSDQSLSLDKSCNLIDDDANGFIDDVRGWDFMNFDRSVEPGEVNANGSGTRHGTYVASAAAANANNGVGIAGVNWQTKILPIQALGDNGSGTTISVARAVRYATIQGADVISLSLGGTYPDSFLRQAITDAVAAGVVIVAAAGNDGCNCISYPANYEEVVAVGALSTSNTRASFSSYGANLDVMAPGVGLYVASWSATNTTSAYASNISGTSLATPLVSAALTILKSHQPTATTAELMALLGESTNRLTLTSTQPRLDTIGFGTIDLFAAATRAVTPVTHTGIISFANTSHGQTLLTTQLEKTTNHTAYQCAAGTYGTTPVYHIAKQFYTTSASEAGQAKALGKTTSLIGYFCSVMPHDTVSSVRLLNLDTELRRFIDK